MKGRRGETERGKRSEEKKLRGTKKRVALYGGVHGSGGGRIRPGEIPIVISRNQIGYQTMPDYQAPMPSPTDFSMLGSRHYDMYQIL